jgi:hypothetical protein
VVVGDEDELPYLVSLSGDVSPPSGSRIFAPLEESPPETACSTRAPNLFSSILDVFTPDQRRCSSPEQPTTSKLVRVQEYGEDKVPLPLFLKEPHGVLGELFLGAF